MSKFRTTISKAASSYDFHHEKAILCMGSCFAEHIGQKLNQYKFSNFINPSGILYNPYSIARTLAQLLLRKEFNPEDIFQYNGQWHSFDHHGKFSNVNQHAMLQYINDNIKHGYNFLKKTKRLILTFGTSNVFVYKKTERIVANCHKVPNHEFERKALSVREIVDQLDTIFKQLKSVNPDLEILLTVSPVRHLRDGLIGNQISKSRLLLACEELVQSNHFVQYFPSYEIMMDDLRDYRFYKSDLIHPSDLAIDYIWSFFEQTFFSAATQQLNFKIEKVLNATQHKAFHPTSEDHQKFINKYLTVISEIKAEHPYLDFTSERNIFRNQLIS